MRHLILVVILGLSLTSCYLPQIADIERENEELAFKINLLRAQRAERQKTAATNVVAGSGSASASEDTADMDALDDESPSVAPAKSNEQTQLDLNAVTTRLGTVEKQINVLKKTVMKSGSNQCDQTLAHPETIKGPKRRRAEVKACLKYQASQKLAPAKETPTPDVAKS